MLPFPTKRPAETSRAQPKSDVRACALLAGGVLYLSCFWFCASPFGPDYLVSSFGWGEEHIQGILALLLFGFSFKPSEHGTLT